MVEFQEFRFHGGQGALRAGPLHAYVFGGVHEMPIQAGIANLSPAIHHGVSRTQQNIIMRRIYHRHMALLQIRSIQNRQRKLAMHIIHMDDVRFELLQQCFKLTLRLK